MPTETPAAASKGRFGWRVSWRVACLAAALLSLAAVVIARTMSERWFDQGAAALRVHRFELADERLRRAGSIDGRDGEVALLRSRVAWVRGDAETSRSQLRVAEQQGLDPSRIDQEELLIQIRGGAAAAMRARLPTMLRRTSRADGPAILEAFAAGFLAQGNVEGASEVLALWENADAGDPRIHHWRGVRDRAFGAPGEAIEHFERALRIAPQMTPSRLALAKILKSDDRFTEALEHYEQIIREEPGNVDAMLGLAVCQLRTKKAERGERGLVALIAAHPDHVSARLELAEHYQDLGQPQNVVSTLQPLVQRDTVDISLHYLMATAYARLGQQQRADEHFDTFQRLNRQLGKTQILKKRYEAEPSAPLARQIAAALMESKWQESGSWIMTALSAEPRDARLHRMMAEYLRRSGRPEVAKTYEANARTLSGPEPR